MKVAPGLERRLRRVEGAAAAVPGPARDAALARRLAALAEVPSPVLRRMLALADMGDAEGQAALVGDPELLAALERVMEAGADG